MYVVPFSMGPLGSPLAKLGVQVTDSPYVVVSMGIMTRMGTAALDLHHRRRPTGCPPCTASALRSLDGADGRARGRATTRSTSPTSRRPARSGRSAPPTAATRCCAKKAFALRIASVMARDEGWLAEHMLILKVTNPARPRVPPGRRVPVAPAARPTSPCCARRFPAGRSRPSATTSPGSRPGAGRPPARDQPRGRLLRRRARHQPERPTRRAIETLWGNTIFTNVALRDDGDVWWEGLTDTAPDHLIDWQGNDWTPASGDARPRIRTPGSPSPPASARRIADSWEDPQGVVIDAIIFGGRRATNVPLVVEARDWEHGVFLGATVSSERTAAAEGTVGELRRDPFAMMPFCGYNMADHWSHWLEVGDAAAEDRQACPASSR